MIKVCILDRCEFCDGEAYIFDCEDVDARGKSYDRYRPCEMCHGSGNRAIWVSLRELADLLERAVAIEPDYLDLARQMVESTYRQSSHCFFPSID